MPRLRGIRPMKRCRGRPVRRAALVGLASAGGVGFNEVFVPRFSSLMMWLGFAAEVLCGIGQGGIPFGRCRQPALKEMLTVVPPEEHLVVLRFYAEKRVVSRRRLPTPNARPAMAARVELGRFDALPV